MRGIVNTHTHTHTHTQTDIHTHKTHTHTLHIQIQIRAAEVRSKLIDEKPLRLGRVLNPGHKTL